MPQQCVIGVDLGGTNVRAAAVSETGELLGGRIEQPSMAQAGTNAIVDAVSKAIAAARALTDAEAVAVGLSVPGHIDNANGLVRWAPNFGETVDGVFHYWKNVPLRDEIESLVELKVVMGNDANCAALGEYRYGSGEGKANCLVLLTLGTGIGGGVVMAPTAVDGKASSPLLLLGGNKGGAELGHVTIAHGGLDCNAGSYGALEGYCQRDAIIKRAQHKLRRGRKSLVNDLVNGDVAKVSPRHLTEAADQGDAVAIEVWREIGTYLGAGIGSFINIFAPDVFAIGGQVSKAGKWIFEPAIAEAERVAIPSLFADCNIVPAQQLDDAGLLGAAALGWETV